MLTRSRSKVRRSRSKVRRSKVRRSRSKVRRSRRKVRRSLQKSKHDVDGDLSFDAENKHVIIPNSDIKDPNDIENKNLKAEIIKFLKNNNIKSPYKIVYESEDREVLTDINKSGEQKNIFETFNDTYRGENNVLVSSGKFTDEYKINMQKKWNDRECSEFRGGSFCNNALDNNNLRRCRINQKTKLCEPIPEEYRQNATNEFIGKVREKTNVENKKEEISNPNNSKPVTRVYKISLLESIAKKTGISLDKLKIILAGATIATLAGIAYYLSKNNKNMSKKEIENYLVNMVNKNKK